MIKPLLLLRQIPPPFHSDSENPKQNHPLSEKKKPKMAISLDRKTSKYCSRQNQFGAFEWGLWKIMVGAPILAARQHQRRAFTQLASQLLKKPSDSRTLPNSFCSIYSRSCSSSPSPPSTHPSSKASNKGFLAWYLGKLQAQPLITKSISTSLIFSLADITSQIITMPPDGSFDAIRMSRMSAYGLLIMGPAQHYWFNYLSKIMPRTNIFTTLTKILMGQTIFGPCINSIFFSYNAVLRGESQQEIVARLKRDLLPTLKNGLMYWPVCDFVTFTFVPVHLQPLMNSSFAYLWTIYLTYMASLKKVDTD